MSLNIVKKIPWYEVLSIACCYLSCLKFWFMSITGWLLTMLAPSGLSAGSQGGQFMICGHPSRMTILTTRLTQSSLFVILW